MTAVVKLLLSDSAQAVKSHVPIHLETIQRIADDCRKWVQEVEGQNKKVIDTLMELNQASLFKQGETEEGHSQSVLMANILATEETQRKEMQARCDKDYEVIQTECNPLLSFHNMHIFRSCNRRLNWRTRLSMKL